MRLTIAKVHENVFEGDAYSVRLPGVAGEFEVLSHHEPLIATLKSGNIVVREQRDSAPLSFPIERGLIEVSRNEAIVLL